MNEFALIFRPTRPVQPDDLPRRNAAARDWALARRNEGTLLRASPLTDEGVKVAEDGATPMADAHPSRPCSSSRRPISRAPSRWPKGTRGSHSAPRSKCDL